jgi:hypothetical protein
MTSLLIVTDCGKSLLQGSGLVVHIVRTKVVVEKTINIRPAMARKILKENGQTVMQSTVCSLTPDKLKSEDHKAKQKAFDVKVHEALGDAF